MDSTGEELEIRLFGDIGKTRLAIAVVEPEAAGFPDVARFVSLSDQDPSWASETARVIQGKALPLVVDGVDGEPSAVYAIRRLLKDNPRLVLLATSRVRLGIMGETVFGLHGIESPPPGQEADANNYEAMARFRQGAERTLPGFPLAASDSVAVSEICRRVGGLPLALNLASACVASLSVSRIAEELRKSFDLLGSRDAAFVSGTGIGTVLHQSLSMLSEHEQSVFARLSVFQGGFEGDAATAVAGADVDLLSGLIRKSFVERLIGSRYDLHPLYRELGRTLLEKKGELDIAYHAQFEYFLAGAEERSRGLLQSASVAPFHRLVVEQTNLAAAYRWALRVDKAAVSRLPRVMLQKSHGFGLHHMRLP